VRSVFPDPKISAHWIVNSVRRPQNHVTGEQIQSVVAAVTLLWCTSCVERAEGHWKNPAVNSVGTEPTRSANLIQRIEATVLAAASE
jgi:hypothetical protein